MAISVQDVKDLRERTSAGIADCKKALEACDGDMEKAIDWLREKGIAKSASKASRIAAEGLANITINGNEAVILEINSETDFSAKTDKFKDMVKVVANAILANKPATVEEALELVVDGQKVSEVIAAVSFATGEKMTLRRFEVVTKTDAQVFGQYVHHDGKTAALAVLDGDKEDVAKSIAMQIASMKPQYVSREAMPQEVVDRETAVQKTIMAEDPKMAGKPEQALAKILEGKVSKALQDYTLNDQLYILDGKTKVSQVLKNAGMSAVSFVLIVVGEGIEKKKDDWVAEVAASMANVK